MIYAKTHCWVLTARARLQRSFTPLHGASDKHAITQKRSLIPRVLWRIPSRSPSISRPAHSSPPLTQPVKPTRPIPRPRLPVPRSYQHPFSAYTTVSCCATHLRVHVHLAPALIHPTISTAWSCPAFFTLSTQYANNASMRFGPDKCAGIIMAYNIVYRRRLSTESK